MKHLLQVLKRFIGSKNKPEPKQNMHWQVACQISKNHLAVLYLSDRIYMRNKNKKTWQRKYGQGMWIEIDSHLADEYLSWEPF